MTELLQYGPLLAGLLLVSSLLWEIYQLLTRDMHPVKVLTTAFSAAVTLGILGLVPLLPASMNLVLTGLLLGLAAATVYATQRLLDEKRPGRVAAVQADGSKAQVAALDRPSAGTLLGGALGMIVLLLAALYAGH